jgi:hypothetical protein
MRSGDRGRGAVHKIRWRLAALSCAAMATALAGCSAGGHAGSGSPKTAALVMSPWRACTEQVTITALDGQMRACIDYSYAHGQLYVRAAAASYTSTSGYDLPYFSFAFLDPASAVVLYKYTTPVFEAENVFSHSTGLIDLTRTAGIHAGDVLQVSLRATSAASAQVDQIASTTLTLYPRGLSCPDLGADVGKGESTGQC